MTKDKAKTTSVDNMIDIVTCQLEQAILNGSFSIGQRLPSERALQKEFQVGRGTIREALRMLSQKGLTETKRGSQGGTYIIEPSTSLLQENMISLLLRSKLSNNHLLEFRSYTDECILQLVVMKHTKETLAPVLDKAKLIYKLTVQTKPNIKKILQLDSELNLLLAQLTDNPLFIFIVEVIQTQFESLDTFLFLHPTYMKEIGKNWLHYIRAISKRDIKEALYRLGYHYELLNTCLKDSQKA